MKFERYVKGLLVVGGACAISLATSMAQASTSHTWNLNRGAGGNGSLPSADRRYVSNNGLGVTISGWYGDETGAGTLNDASSSLRHWNGGLGIDRNNDRHTVDNDGSTDELVAFYFDEAVSLDAMRFGWYENDSDATILYQTNQNAGFSGLGSTSISNLTNNGYSLLGNLLDPGTSTSSLPGDLDSPPPATPIYSKVWLVGAYLQGVTGNSDTWAAVFDSFKIKTLVAHTAPGTAVSLPATAMLMIFGLLSLRSRRGAYAA